MIASTEYDHVISLGRACQPAYQIRRLTGVRSAHVFDWIITPDDALIQWISSDFDGFFQRERLALGPDQCVIDRPTRTRFVHEFPPGTDIDAVFDENAARYAALIERWRVLLRSGARVLFVRQHEGDHARSTALRLRDLLSEKAPQLPFDLLCLTENEQSDWGAARIVNQRLPQPEPYVWTGDDAAWERILGAVGAIAGPRITPRLANVRHVFICGLHRSGTSPLHEVLKAHPEVTGFVNTGVPKDEGQHLQSVLEPDGAFGGPGEFCFDNHARLTEADRPTYATRLPTMRAEWERHWERDRAIRIEKSPPNLIRTRFLQSAFADARFVFIVRHPLAVARAMKKWKRISEERALRHWLAAHRIMLQDARRLRRSVCVRYEDLTADLNGVLPRVWHAMEATPIDADVSAFTDQNSAYLTHAHQMPLSWDDRRVLANFGYSLEPPYVDTERRYGW